MGFEFGPGGQKGDYTRVMMTAFSLTACENGGDAKNKLAGKHQGMSDYRSPSLNLDVGLSSVLEPRSHFTLILTEIIPKTMQCRTFFHQHDRLNIILSGINVFMWYI